ncbi:hypothetical protein DNTS_006392 [Danionella cerebrum]|uniref:Uncharacterized protein n=1 Tax=Danionella cerebrum TaxID=2873325 RepID=A0A553NGV9_9TELE|nr:hypothetical protein DNTS_006392 [Danionella translucida]
MDILSKVEKGLLAPKGQAATTQHAMATLQDLLCWTKWVAEVHARHPMAAAFFFILGRLWKPTFEPFLVEFLAW